MKAILVTLFVISFGICKGQGKPDSTNIEYQVTVANEKAQLIINYNDENQKYTGGSGKNEWVYNFSVSKKPFTSMLLVNLYPADGISKTTATLKILVNGKVVRSVTGIIKVSNGEPTSQQIQYILR